DEINKIIEERISAWTFLPKENSKYLSVLHFGPEDAKQKYNYFHNESEEQVDQPLLATVILYLSNVSTGGQILFPQSESSTNLLQNKMWSDCAKTNEIVRPMKGNTIVFFNLNLNATPDRTSFHSRCPVPDGDMWCATKFIYLKKISADNDLPQSDDGDCTDEDDNCPRWAAIGECQRNSVFMTGSPDYYGTCRKSCNAC
ncbi:probable prolyl 4-hydroxylase 12, partial [Phtheirospermum japonicum]